MKVLTPDGKHEVQSFSSKLKKSQIFDQNDGLTPFEKFSFCFFHKQLFLKSLKAAFLFRTSANTFSRSMFIKHKRSKNFNFLTKIMDYPLSKNASFAFFLKPSLYCLERLVFKGERHQILFLGVFCIKRKVKKISTF